MGTQVPHHCTKFENSNAVVISNVCCTYRPHPYIFFNEDRQTLTFMGFRVTKSGDLLDPTSNQLLERGIMTSQLFSGLQRQGVNFSEDYKDWKRRTQIEKLATVMGIKCLDDPDPTYVLTVDNMIKMLAIHVRFRYYCFSVLL